MGRNSPTSRQVIEQVGEMMRRMTSSMRQEDRKVMEEIILMGKIHAAEMDLSMISPEMAFLLSAIMEIMRGIENE
ncbi:hypothetical protein [Acidiphilium sp.]|jgi:hypothetical protein|uniref:hypothetical protein n=1 Tax=Acidiphilium sp. TaxID=527 RepID=UPI002585F1D8|nr:hypothetical protein [Acidiphilium sp.]